jgi:hypothetical protein
MTQLQDEVRRALAEIADAPPPAGLAAAVIARVRRRRQRIAAAVAGVAVVAVTVTVGLSTQAVRPDPHWQADPSISATLAPDRRVVAAYSGLTPGTATEEQADWTLVRNPATGAYRKVPYRLVTAAPAGDRMLVTDQGGSGGGILDARTGETAWIDGYTNDFLDASWSPDGRTIALTVSRKDDGAFGFALLDVGRRHVGPLVEVDTTGGPFVWAPDGQSLVISPTHSAGDEALPDVVENLSHFDLTGRLLRTVPITAGVVRAASDFSPDGGRIAMSDWVSRRIVVVDARSGEVVAQPATGAMVGWYDDNHLVVYNSIAKMDVVDLAGTVVHTYDIPAEAQNPSTMVLAPRR